MATISTTIKINDAFSNPLDRLSAGLARGQSAMNRLKGALSGNAFNGATKSSDGFFKSMTGGVVVGNLISKGMGLASQGIRSMVGELDEASTAWQTFDGNMHQIGRSPAQIASAKADMQKFAQQTIYSASDMASTYSQLAAVGVKNTGKLVRGFGGLAAASSNPQQAMKTLSEQATQMAAKPKVQWQDFKLMLEQTPAGISAVAKTMGENTTQLIKDVQDGKIATKDFLNAVAKTGTNANFTKMATQYKTVGQAMDGLKETLANGLQPQFQKLSKIGIDAISSLTDKLGNLNWNAFGNGLINAVNYVKPALQALKIGFEDFTKGFQSTGVGDSMLDMFHSIADAVMNVTDTMNEGNGKGSLFEQLGKLSGGTLSSIAQAISGIADAVGDLKPYQLQALAQAFVALRGGIKGLILMEVAKALAKLNQSNPGTIRNLADSLTKLAFAFATLKAIYQGMQFLKDIKSVFGGLKGAKAPKMQTPEVSKPGRILQSAGAYMKLSAALLMVGGSIAAAAGGFKLMADASSELAKSGGAAIAVFFGMLGAFAALAVLAKVLGPSMLMGALGLMALGAALLLTGAGLKLVAGASDQLASSGGAAIGVFFGMLAAVAALAVLVKFLGPSMIGASLGFLVFAGALVLIGIAIFIASAGMTLLATQLPVISQYGLSAALGILALAGAIALFGIAAIIGAVGLIALGIALVVVAVGFTIAAIGAILLGVALIIVGVGAIVAAVGMMLLGIALALVAVFVLVAAVGMILLGVGLVLVAVAAMIGAVGLMLMAVALMLIMVSAMIASVGLMLLGVALILIGPMALIAGVGLMLLGVGAMAAGAGLMLVAGAAMAAAAGIMMIGVAVMVMVSLFISAFSMLVSTAVSGMARVRSAISSGISSAVGAVRGFVGSMVSAGAALMQGLVNGIKSMIGAAVSAAQSAASQVAGAIKGFLHIGSPSRLMYKYGRWIDQGLINGINRDADSAALASKNMAQNIAGNVSDINPSVGIGLRSNPGDLLADSFDRALASVLGVSDAMDDLDGSQAKLGFNSSGTVSGNLGANSVTSSSLVPNSFTTSRGNTSTDNSQQITIARGAITVNSTGNPAEDADRLLTELENRIIDQQYKALG